MTDSETETTRPFSEIHAEGFKRWYCFGWRSPEILVARWHNKHRFWFRLRMAWQRARHGYCDAQFWSLDYAVAELVVRGTQGMRKWANGYPMEFSDPPYGDGQGWDAWEKVLVKIEEGFQAWLDSDGWFKNVAEQEKFDEGMKLFAKYFSALWD